jgi:hypothetical protein
LVDDIGISNGDIEIRVQNGNWVYVRFFVGFKRNEEADFQNFGFYLQKGS